MHRLRFRQVHLDFHTSGDIRGIGEKFSRRQFQEALKVGQVDSITLFSKCHHGWSYHPTKIGRRHPHLKFDLLARQIDACRAIGVRCPIYLSAGVDELAAMEHPDWVVKNRDGSTYPPLQAGWFKLLRFNSPYLDYLCDQIAEVVQRWPDHDGLFFDIVGPRHDYSEPALREMKKLGLNPENPADVDDYAQRVLLNYYKRTNAAARNGRRETPIFHNGGHVPVGATRFNRFNSHLELESLPTGGWGYDHFALSARYAATTGMNYLGMTGKFHTTWGEFGGFKRPAALRYECGAMLANGAKCSIGDQLHPSGEMNSDTYRLVGDAYAEVQRKEPWCDQVWPVARIAIASAERDQPRARGSASVSLADEGAARMLLEAHLPFLVLDDQASWEEFELIILPDTTVLTPATMAKTQRFLANGGKLLAAGSALLNSERSAFAIDPGAALVGRSPYDPDYLVATALTPEVSIRSPIVIHGGAYEIQPTTARVLVARRVPYFNRTWEHFCSHQHAPDSGETATPAAVLSDQIAYFAHDIFTRYRHYGQPLYRDFVRAAMGHLLGGAWPAETTLPTTARLNVWEQPREKRYVAHLLFAPITLRGSMSKQGLEKPLEIIEDLVPLRDTRVRLRLPKAVKSVRLVPEGAELDFTTNSGGIVDFVVPEFTGHQMIELRYRYSKER